MSSPGGHYFEELLIETKGAKTTGNLPTARITTLHPVWVKLVRKSGGYKIDVARLGYNEHFFE